MISDSLNWQRAAMRRNDPVDTSQEGHLMMIHQLFNTAVQGG